MKKIIIISIITLTLGACASRPKPVKRAVKTTTAVPRSIVK